MSTKKVIKTHSASLTPVSDKKRVAVEVEDLARLREIRSLVEANNQSRLSTEVVICQITWNHVLTHMRTATEEVREV